MPADDAEAGQLFNHIDALDGTGELPDGWGQISSWPADRITDGDWSAAMWRSPKLADTAARFAGDNALRFLTSVGLSGHSTGQQLSNGYARSTVGTPSAFPILDRKGVDVQQTIEGAPDEHWVWQGEDTAPILSKAGHLFLTTGQWMPASRLTALAATEAYVGRGWRPVTGATPEQAQALAVFINSTVGRLVLMRLGARFLHFPNYNTAAVNALPVPDITNPGIIKPLAACWQSTRTEVVPQFRDGYTSVRRRWDEAVCSALSWDTEEIASLGERLAQEPRVRGVARGQWKP